MLFGRGQWAIVGLEPESLSKFQESLANSGVLFDVSQLKASVLTKFEDRPSVGINPFDRPRYDEGLADTTILSDLHKQMTQVPEGAPLTLPAGLDDFFGSDEEAFALGDQKFGLWFVMNDHEDVTDIATRKEGVAYDNMQRPFKYLNKEEKKGIEDAVTATEVIVRKQIPVLLDFQHGRLYIASGKEEVILQVREFVTLLGAKTFSVRWDFKGFDWTQRFFKYVIANTHFTAEMKRRAEDLARFRADEIEKFDDKNVEKVVSNFFAIAELENEHWVGLSTGARIKLHTTSDPVAVTNPSTAFELLLQNNREAEVATASVVFQELRSIFTKKGEEKQIRNDLFTIDLNDKVNVQEAGAAMLRGFDLPGFKRDIKTTLKAKGQMDVRDFWYMWLQGVHDAVLSFVDNMTTALELDKRIYGLMAFESETVEAEEVEV